MKSTIKWQMQAFFTDGKKNDPFPVRSEKEFDRLRSGHGWDGVGARLIKTETTVAREYPAGRPRSY